MIDRTQLTEALAQWRDPDAHPLENVDGMTAIVNAAVVLLDFPTDEQVEAATVYHNGRPILDGDRAMMRATLEAVRQTIIGDNQ